MNNGWRIVGIIAAFLLVFIFGAVLGGGGVILYTQARMQTFRAEWARERGEREAKANEERTEKGRLIDALHKQVQQLQTRLAGGPMRLPAPEQYGARLMQRFVNQLHPTDEQRAKIQPMVNQTAEELRRLRRDTGHSTEIALEKLEDQISTVLTPAQRDQFNDLIQRWRDAFERFNRMQQERQAEQRLREGQQRRNAPAATAAPAAPSAQ